MTDHSSTRDRLEGSLDETKGTLKQALGDVTRDEQMQGEGMVDEVKGQAQQAWADLKDAVDDLKEGVERTTR